MTSIREIPDYSDLGKSDSITKNAWEAILAKYDKYQYYYSGSVFREKVDDSELIDPPSLYPVGINLVKMLCQSMAWSTFGEWDKMPVRWATRHGIKESNSTVEACKLMDDFLFRSNAESVFLQMEIQRMLLGASVIKVRPDLPSRGVSFHAIKPSSFFPVFDPHNPNRLLKAHVTSYLSREQAKVLYDYQGKKDEVLFEEIWTLHEHKTILDGKIVIKKYSGRNPYGLIPFVYIPRMRSVSEWGDSLAEDIIPVQDELNMRVADVGDAVNTNAHPIRWGKNLPNNFNTDNFPIGSDAFWDLGRSFGDSEPEVGALEIANPVPQGALDNISWLYDWVRTSTFAPPIAFGEDNGGGQRSGVTLEIRMAPLIRAVRAHRAFMRTGLREVARISGTILRQKGFGVPVKVLDALIEAEVVPSFAEIMPRDRANLVDEVVKRLSTEPPTISLETALGILGSDAIEDDRIDATIKKYGLDKKQEQTKKSDKEPKNG